MKYSYDPIDDTVTLVQSDGEVSIDYIEATEILKDVAIIRDELKKTEFTIGNITMKRAKTNLGVYAIMIKNNDGKDESILIFEDEWNDFIEAVNRMDEEMKSKRIIREIPEFDGTMDALNKLCDFGEKE